MTKEEILNVLRDILEEKANAEKMQIADLDVNHEEGWIGVVQEDGLGFFLQLEFE